MKKIKKSVEVSGARAEAKRNLSDSGKRLQLIEAFVLLCLLVPVYICLYNTFEVVSWQVEALLPSKFSLFENFGAYLLSISVPLVHDLFAALLTVFVSLPLLLGVFRMGKRIDRGEDTDLLDLFSSFTKEEYPSALRLSFGFAWRIAIVATAVALTFSGCKVLFQGSWLGILTCSFLILFELVFSVNLLAKRFSVLYFRYACGQSVKQSRKSAKRFDRMCHFGAIRYLLSFLPRILLSVLTLGILFLADTFPQMLVTYFRFCRKTNDIIQSEENNYE